MTGVIQNSYNCSWLQKDLARLQKVKSLQIYF